MVKKWLRNWFWFKKNWFLNKTARRLLFTPGGTVHRLVHGSASARTRFGHGLAEIWFRHFIEHLACTGTVHAVSEIVRVLLVATRNCPGVAEDVSEKSGRDLGFVRV